MFEKNLKQKTNLGLVVTFAVLMGACTSKSIKMESSELALDVPEQEQVVAGDATPAPLDDGTMLVNEDTYKAPKTAQKKSKRKGLKSHSIAKKAKKSTKTLALNDKPQVSAAAAITKEIETPKTFDQELTQYPANETLNNIVVPAPMEEAAMVDEGSSTGFWMYVLAGFMVTLGAAGYVWKTRFAKSSGKNRKLVYRG